MGEVILHMYIDKDNAQRDIEEAKINLSNSPANTVNTLDADAHIFQGAGER